MRTLVTLLLVVFCFFWAALAVIALCAILYGYAQCAGRDMGHEASGFMDIFWLAFLVGLLLTFLSYSLLRRMRSVSRSIPETHV